MSEYVLIQTRLTDADRLVEALTDMGFAADAIERHPRPVPLMDYLGLPRPEQAEIVIRRRHVGALSNDIGFQRQPDGTWRAIISAYDQVQPGRHGPYNARWLGQLTQAYAVRALTQQYQRQGWRVQVARRADGAVHVTAER